VTVIRTRRILLHALLLELAQCLQMPRKLNTLNPAFKAQCSRLVSRMFCRLRNKNNDGVKDDDTSTTCTAAGARTVTMTVSTLNIAAST
jgi:hypothetical protein